jgi:drug/metabolite transporter (DMT)-like permease
VSKIDLNPPRPRSRARAYFILFSLSVIWGLAFVAIRAAGYELSPTSLSLLRWLIASAVFAALLPFARSRMRFERRDVPRLVVVGLMNVVLYGLTLNYAETTISAGLAGLLVSLGPVFMVVFSVLTLKEIVGRRLIYALVLAVLGSVLLSVSELNVRGDSLTGSLEAIFAALMYAGFTILAKPLIEKYGALPVTIWSSIAGTVFLLPFLSAEFFRQVDALSYQGWFSVLYLSVFSTVIGYSLFYTLVGKGAVSTLSVQLYLVPIVGVVGGILILQEQLTIFTILGGAATLAAVGLARTTKRR